MIIDLIAVHMLRACCAQVLPNRTLYRSAETSGDSADFIRLTPTRPRLVDTKRRGNQGSLIRQRSSVRLIQTNAVQQTQRVTHSFAAALAVGFADRLEG